ncbi:hypothetical protein HMPREF9193_01718 [Treponema lecithinolyticum ATCC 700332]|uniref:Uncharacterized protein n=1 Tax=Treponema lecithinolyticum ATCC 700332 TaxID=1321815 RepID=A0ABN0NXF6_TRELE|nr:hypothetical protein HMPREF9193_01718 [Treponema lecithinolyticum ATCC 700332]
MRVAISFAVLSAFWYEPSAKPLASAVIVYRCHKFNRAVDKVVADNTFYIAYAEKIAKL